MIVIIVILVILVLVALYFVAQYNGLVRLRNRVEAAWAQIEVQLKRRWDLIPNLIETVKGYASHEKETLERVVAARNAAVAAPGPMQAAQSENVLTGALRQLFALAEAYPDLKANTNFLQLQEELTGTEGRISFARQYYNDSVLTYNNKTQTVPSSIIANMFGFKQKEYFEVEEEAKSVPKVQF